MKRHGQLVVWLIACLTSLAASPSAVSANDETGFRAIFNGRDLSGWDGNPKFWSVKDGSITGQTTAENPTLGNTFLIWRHGLLDDFELRLSFRIEPNNDKGFANSGIQYRSKESENWVVRGYQADFEAGTTYSGILYEEGGRAILAQRGQKVVIRADESDRNKPKTEVVGAVGDSATIQAAIKKGEWNDYAITARGNHLTHRINGHLTVDVTDEHAERRAASGILALQLHAGDPMTVQVKNIRLKRLPLVAAKKIVLVAGTPSHGPGDHEFNAGVLLLKKCLDSVPGVLANSYQNGWPKDPTAFDNADTILLYMDGGDGHPAIHPERLKLLRTLMDKGVGLACAHYAVEVPKDRGGPEFLDWIGGYFEAHWSVNPHWTARYDKLPDHAITRGVNPFEINDEWYYHMRFRAQMKGVTPILTGRPTQETLSRPDGSHSGNPAVREAIERGEPQHTAWAVERPDGGRGFGFTGGHKHANWGNDDFRKIVLNALLWTAKADVPHDGVKSSVTPADVQANLDPKGK
jgi:type 1 glutamine amidotransferase